MSPASQPILTPQQFLLGERQSAIRHEYFRGQVVAMAGASVTHNRLVRNVVSALDRQLRGGPCEVFPSDLRVYCPAGLMTYPDAQVICGPVEYFDDQDDTVINPRVIVEVLSKSTERYDRGQKFGYYRTIPALVEYVLVAHREPLLERFVRQQQGWLLTEARGLEASLELSAIGCTLALADVYRDVSFSAPMPGIVRIDDEEPPA